MSVWTILVTWGNGRLGKACQIVMPDALYPNRQEMDVTSPESIEAFFLKNNITTVVHLVAIASIPKCESDKWLAWKTNVEWVRSMLQIAKKHWVKKFLYLQTACIFSWEEDYMYDEDSLPNPKHYYGLTKLVGEEAVRSYHSEDFQTIIVRTNFTTMPWEYPKAFTDRFGTYLFAEWVCQGIQEILESDTKLPVIHLCWDRELSMYEYATLGGSNVEPMTLEEYKWPPLTRRMSLTSKWWKRYTI